MDVYTTCPHFITNGFTLRQVRRADAPGLLKVYSDKTAQFYFNTDARKTDLRFCKLREMEQCIDEWLRAYGRREYVRWTVLRNGRAVGTMEMSRLDGDADGRGRGVLRMDMLSMYEFPDVYDDLLRTMLPEMFELFGVNRILTKATPQMERRRLALVLHGFFPCKDVLVDENSVEYGSYWARRNIP